MNSLFAYRPVTEIPVTKPLAGTIKLLPSAQHHFGKVLPFAFSATDYAEKAFAFGVVGRNEAKFSGELATLLRDRRGSVAGFWESEDEDLFGHVTVAATHDHQPLPAERNLLTLEDRSANMLDELRPPIIVPTARKLRALPPEHEF